VRKYDLVGKVFASNNFGDFEVVDVQGSTQYNHTLYQIKFLATGSTKIVTRGAIRKGNIKDNFVPSVVGVGFVGDFRDRIGKKTNDPDVAPLHQRWTAMLRRVYNPECSHYSCYGGAGVTVDASWLNFTNFYLDCLELPNFDLGKIKRGELSLDKDVKVPGSKVYSKETCSWLSPRDNSRGLLSRSRAFVAVTPAGERYEGLSIREFAEKHNLDRKTVTFALEKGTKTSKVLKGWKFYYK